MNFINTKGQSHLLTLVKLHIEYQMGWEIKVCSWNLGHMTKMVAMPINGKKDLKFFISGTERPMTLKQGMQHWD